MTLRAQFAKTTMRLMDEDEKIVVLLGDIGVFSFRAAFEKHPTRCLNMGVCEAATVGFAAGLAMAGYYPIVSTIETFLLRRAYEFLRLDFAMQGLSGLFIGVGGAREYAKLGGTHMCKEGVTLALSIFGSIKYPHEDGLVDDYISVCVQNRKLSYIRLEEPHVSA